MSIFFCCSIISLIFLLPVTLDLLSTCLRWWLIIITCHSSFMKQLLALENLSTSSIADLIFIRWCPAHGSRFLSWTLHDSAIGPTFVFKSDVLLILLSEAAALDSKRACPISCVPCMPSLTHAKRYRASCRYCIAQQRCHVLVLLQDKLAVCALSLPSRGSLVSLPILRMLYKWAIVHENRILGIPFTLASAMLLSIRWCLVFVIIATFLCLAMTMTIALISPLLLRFIRWLDDSLSLLSVVLFNIFVNIVFLTRLSSFIIDFLNRFLGQLTEALFDCF